MREREFVNVNLDGEVIRSEEAVMAKKAKKAQSKAGSGSEAKEEVGEVVLNANTLVVMGLGTAEVGLGVLENVIRGGVVSKRVVGVPGLEVSAGVAAELWEVFREARRLHRTGEAKPEVREPEVVKARKLGD